MTSTRFSITALTCFHVGSSRISSGLRLTNGRPSSPALRIAGSSGMAPRNGTPISSAARSPPPFPKRSISLPQWGQAMPLMFSMMPITGSPISWTNRTAFLMSRMATSCGVVTITAPAMFGADWAMVRASSPVPGGRSTTR